MAAGENDGHYFPDPGTVKTAKCGLCGTKMDVKRGVNGPTGFMMAMSGSKRLHDSFRCPHYDAEWHDQARQLKREMENTPSPTMRRIYKKDLAKLVADKLNKPKKGPRLEYEGKDGKFYPTAEQAGWHFKDWPPGEK